eukprot:CAMPEP_0179094074 /NCGR_PEP_ID=MMETSP0796-20121207/43123_1 /TAXON_ID=73915 /ORGANISM="Pyrodinium bahamense, Strain pbaha01" /LENGTH=264 /DNA_ID=CAMNT_0020791735 /DNA_START=95 /DNA_END=890 /DNA_ORIENTATION=-
MVTVQAERAVAIAVPIAMIPVSLPASLGAHLPRGHAPMVLLFTKPVSTPWPTPRAQGPARRVRSQRARPCGAGPHGATARSAGSGPRAPGGACAAGSQQTHNRRVQCLQGAILAEEVAVPHMQRTRLVLNIAVGNKYKNCEDIGNLVCIHRAPAQGVGIGEICTCMRQDGTDVLHCVVALVQETQHAEEELHSIAFHTTKPRKLDEAQQQREVIRAVRDHAMSLDLVGRSAVAANHATAGPPAAAAAFRGSPLEAAHSNNCADV